MWTECRFKCRLFPANDGSIRLEWIDSSGPCICPRCGRVMRQLDWWGHGHAHGGEIVVLDRVFDVEPTINWGLALTTVRSFILEALAENTAGGPHPLTDTWNALRASHRMLLTLAPRPTTGRRTSSAPHWNCLDCVRALVPQTPGKPLTRGFCQLRVESQPFRFSGGYTVRLGVIPKADAVSRWHGNCPYAVLVYASQLATVSERDLRHFVRDYAGLTDEDSASPYSGIVDILLTGAICKNIGKARSQLCRLGLSSVVRMNRPFTATLVAMSYSNNRKVCMASHTPIAEATPYSRACSYLTRARLSCVTWASRVTPVDDILDLVPSVTDLSVPEAEPDLEPVFFRWQQPNHDGIWLTVGMRPVIWFAACAEA